MTPAPVKPAIPFTALEAVDVRVGTIVAVEDVPKSDKLLRLIVDFGDHTRRILAGMKQERANPAEIAQTKPGPGTAAKPNVATARQPAAKPIHPRREPTRSASHGTTIPAGIAATPMTASRLPERSSLHPYSW